MTLSVAMIVKDEALNIGRCLASVVGLADQIVVVDTGSTDTTVDIATSFGAEVGHFKWNNNYSDARNESLKMCRGDWVMVLDADEAMDPNDFSEISKAMTKEDRSEIYAFRVKNYCHDGSTATFDHACVKNDGLYPEYPYYTMMGGIRMFRNHSGIAYIGRLHEDVGHCFSDEAPLLGVTVHHFGKLDATRELFKREYYLELALKDLEERPDDLYILSNAISQARIAKQWEKSRDLAERYIRVTHTCPATILITLAESHQVLGDHGKALIYFQNVLRQQPDNALVLNRMSLSLAALGHVDEACYALHKAIHINPGFVSSFLILSDIEKQRGGIHWAKDVLELGLEYNPKDIRLYSALGALVGG